MLKHKDNGLNELYEQQNVHYCGTEHDNSFLISFVGGIIIGVIIMLIVL